MSERTSKLLVETVQDATVISFLENSILDASQIAEIHAQLNALADERKFKKLVFDFAEVRFLSSQALGMLITLQKRLSSAGGTMKIASMKPELQQVFRITKLDRLFEFHPGTDAALQSYGITPPPTN